MSTLEWNSDDAGNLRKFLETDSGAKFIPYLASWRPGLGDGSDQGKTLVSSGKVGGYELALENIRELCESQLNVPETEKYPSIDDDGKWPQ